MHQVVHEAVDSIFLGKQRGIGCRDRSVDVEVPDLSAWKGCQPVLVDDIASSGRTMIEAARKLVLQEFPQPVCALIHGIFAEDSYERIPLKKSAD